jgi:hypothetical protein
MACHLPTPNVSTRILAIAAVTHPMMIELMASAR